jgi:hypothetical protein
MGLDNTSGGSGQTFSDDFAGTGALSANWNVASGTIARLSGVFFVSPTSVDSYAVWTTQTDTVAQYIKVTFTTVTGQFPWLQFRGTDTDGSPSYIIIFKPGLSEIEWYNVGANQTVQTQSGATVANGQVWGVTCSGTGTSTVINLWLNPTGDVPDSAGSWGGDNTPTYSFTNDPATPLNTGRYLGLGSYSDSGGTSLDSFFAGDIP